MSKSSGMDFKQRIKIKKGKLEIRREWFFSPFTRVFKSKKDYNRSLDKINLRRSYGDH